MKGTVVRTALQRIASALAVIAFVAGMSWFFWPNPEAPKTELRLDRSQAAPSPTKHVAPTARFELMNELEELGYTPGKAVTNDNESRSTYQIWTSPGKPKVELNDLGSGIYRLHTVWFEGGAGTWDEFWCSPADGESLTYTTNFGKTIRSEIKDGSADLISDTETPSGTKFVQWSTLTCFVSND